MYDITSHHITCHPHIDHHIEGPVFASFAAWPSFNATKTTPNPALPRPNSWWSVPMTLVEQWVSPWLPSTCVPETDKAFWQADFQGGDRFGNITMARKNTWKWPGLGLVYLYLLVWFEYYCKYSCICTPWQVVDASTRSHYLHEASQNIIYTYVKWCYRVAKHVQNSMFPPITQAGRTHKVYRHVAMINDPTISFQT